MFVNEAFSKMVRRQIKDLFHLSIVLTNLMSSIVNKKNLFESKFVDLI